MSTRDGLAGRKVLLVDDVRNTGQTLTLLATAQICDRMETMIELGVPNVPLAEYTAPPNFVADTCPLCRAGVPITTF